MNKPTIGAICALAGIGGTLLVVNNSTKPYPLQPTTKTYQSFEQIKGHKQGIISQETTPYTLDLLGLYGENYVAQANEKSATGFSLLQLDNLTEKINEKTKRVNLKSNKSYLARPVERGGKPLEEICITTPRSVIAKRENPTPSNTLKTLTIGGFEYEITTMTIGNQEYFMPHLINPKEKNLNFLTIPVENHEREISPDGKITIINPGNIYEWVESSIIKNQEELEAKRKADEETIRKAKEEELRIQKDNQRTGIVTLD